jgi:hypothetical protein
VWISRANEKWCVALETYGVAKRMPFVSWDQSDYHSRFLQCPSVVMRAFCVGHPCVNAGIGHLETEEADTDGRSGGRSL